MRLFIFNSKEHFIPRTAMTLLLLLGAWICLVGLAKPTSHVTQSPWQFNVIAAQRVMWEKPDIVMVGSSLSARIKPELLPDGMGNLSFSGGSALTGLEIISLGEMKPKQVWIEINFIHRSLDKEFTSALFAPVISQARKVVPALREENRPYNIFISLLSEPKAQRPLQTIAEEKERYAKNIGRILGVQKKDYAMISKYLPDRLEKLDEYISSLRKEGVQVVFHEIPVHPELAVMPRALVIKETLLERYPPEPGITWIDSPNPGRFATTDGLHLTPASAHLYYQEVMRPQVQ